jgi:hypothetical protein
MEECWEANRLCESCMARLYSSDLGERVVEAVDESATWLDVAERFGVRVSSAIRWHQAWRETGTLEALQGKLRAAGRLRRRDSCSGGGARRSYVRRDRCGTVQPLATRQPYSVVSFSGASRLYAQKVLHASEQEQVDVAHARRRWIREQGLLVSTHLVVIAETWVNTNMTRACRRGPSANG